MHIIEMKTITITKKGELALPKKTRSVKGFREGDKVVCITHKDSIELIPLSKWVEKNACALMSEKSLAKDWLSPEEDERWKHL